jgi:hypothetical protein
VVTPFFKVSVTLPAVSGELAFSCFSGNVAQQASKTPSPRHLIAFIVVFILASASLPTH